ncbi:hypothetical protein HYH03_009596 [Edaphochlamys debaryana]|uniref:Uncharacterized protein n=1 Tax=Edaphochlamys debaryana TaxID=47281 RepID=A0A835XY82_9CHLO|nr:hypothetical protein HYH03_009596 [Edaphochlamys debaryana]|eukprot:KAG2492105.1 hypothetical protein HYH03_009596 [Edaphochlamys debaryana]
MGMIEDGGAKPQGPSAAAAAAGPRRRDLAGRVALVTGATSGLGLEAAAQLAARGAKVLFGVRNPSKAAKVAESIRSRYPHQALDLALPPHGLPPLDLQDPASIAAFARHLLEDTHTPIDILINNAGTSMLSGPAITDLGVNSLVQVNYLGPYALTRLLEPKLVASRARVVCVSSVTHRCYEIPTDPRVFLHSTSTMTYPWTKLAAVLFVYELQRRLGHLGVTACAVDPGGVRTSIWDEVPALAAPPARWVIEALYAPPSDGAEILVEAATRPWEQDLAPHVTNPRSDLRYYARGAFASPALALIDAPWRVWYRVVKPSLYGTSVILHSLLDYPVRHWSGGRAFNRVVPVRSSTQTYDSHLAAALWAYSEKAAGLSDLAAQQQGLAAPPPAGLAAPAHLGGGAAAGFLATQQAQEAGEEARDKQGPPAAVSLPHGDDPFGSPQATPNRKRSIMSPVQAFPTGQANPPLEFGTPSRVAAGPGAAGASASGGKGVAAAAGGIGGGTDEEGGAASASRRRLVAAHPRRDADGADEATVATAAAAGFPATAVEHLTAAAAGEGGGGWGSGMPSPAVPSPPPALRQVAEEHGLVLPGPDAAAAGGGGVSNGTPGGGGGGGGPDGAARARAGSPLGAKAPAFDEPMARGLRGSSASGDLAAAPPPTKRPHKAAGSPSPTAPQQQPQQPAESGPAAGVLRALSPVHSVPDEPPQEERSPASPSAAAAAAKAPPPSPAAASGEGPAAGLGAPSGAEPATPAAPTVGLAADAGGAAKAAAAAAPPPPAVKAAPAKGVAEAAASGGGTGKGGGSRRGKGGSGGGSGSAGSSGGGALASEGGGASAIAAPAGGGDDGGEKAKAAAAAAGGRGGGGSKKGRYKKRH